MARKRSASNKVPNQGGLAFGRNLMVLGGLIFAPGAYGTVEGALTLRWPRAEATITTADLVRQMSTARGIDGRSFEEGWNSFHVLYHYNVAGREYVADGVEPYDFGMQNSAGAAKMRERHPPGSKALIVYDPDNPAVAYLEPGPSSFALMLSGIGTFMALCGLWIRRKAAQGIGRVNQEGATERIAKAMRDGNPTP
jgi:hypothetical protein